MGLLEVRKLKVSFKNYKESVVAIDDINFNLNHGEILGIVGESGSGKSVTSLAIMKLIEENQGKINSGEIYLEGIDILKLKEKEMCKIRGKDISMIFQEPMTSLNPVMTIYKQIKEIYKIHGKEGQHNYEDILKLLNNLNIPEPELILKKYPFELSGGMRQRIMIAMAMACEPKIIIADEPTTALDVTTQAEILQLLRNITQNGKTSIILITHDLGVIAELAQRVIVMYRGKIVEQCDVLEFFNSPNHPYSKGLLEAMPDNFNKRFKSIVGNVPSIHEKIKGCYFATRCPYCMDICKIEMPQLKLNNNGHKVACWLTNNNGKGGTHNDKTQ